MTEELITKARSPSGREGPDHGKTVVDGIVRRTSVSALQMADDSTSAGCLRKWWYDKVMGRSEPTTKAQANGTRLHGEMEAYLKTGEPRLSDQILRHLHFVPRPGSDLLVEHPTIPELSDGSSGLHLAPLRAAGIPVVGFIDLVHDRLTNQGGTEIEDTDDPPGTVEVIDWKFPGSMDFAKQGRELVKTIQMAGYGKYVFEVVPDAKLVRLSHGYMPTRGRGSKATVRADRDTIEKSWEHAESVARSTVDAARETDADKVTANRRACRAYNKQCIHASNGYCTAGMHNSLRALIGATASSALLAPEDDPVGLTILDRIRQTSAAPAAPQPVAATIALSGTVTPPVPVVPTGPTPEEIATARALEVAKLQAEEANARAVRNFEALADKVLAHNMGFPALAGVAAGLSTQAPGSERRAPGGLLGAVDTTTGTVFTIEDPAVLAQLLQELDAAAAARALAAVGTPAPQPGGILSPETPVVVVPVQVSTPAPTTPTVIAPDRQAALALGLSVVGAIVVESAEATATKTRKPRAAKVDAGVAAPSTDDRVILIVDGTVEGIATTSLHGLIDEWCSALASKFDAADIRCAAQDGPLGYNKWRGALAAFVRETSAQLPAGVYSIDTRGNELAEIVVQALAPRIRTSGGFVFRGIR